MRTRIAVAIAMAVIALSFHYGVRAQTQDHPQSPQPAAETRSVWDGVYTTEQARRGGDIYYSQCSTCHGEKLEGVDDAPSLAGKEFLDGWDGRTVGALFEKMRTKMPRDNPGRLDRQTYLDATAYILSANQFPAGQTELPQDLAPLKLIRIDAVKPEPKK
jgi:mono/diheme cytochrome c family protein